MTQVRVKWDAGKKVWYARPYLGTDPATKTKIRPYRQFPDAVDEQDAQRMAEEWVATLAAAHDNRVPQRLARILAAYIDWKELRGEIAVSTARTYRSCVRCYIDPYLGARDPRSIQAWELQGLYNALLISGARRPGRGISTSKLEQLHWLLAGAWKWMVVKGFADEDPIPALDRPASLESEAIPLSDAERTLLQQAALDVMSGKPPEVGAALSYGEAVAVMVALETGVRCGEACALMERDAWWRMGQLHVAATVIEDGGAPKLQTHTKGKRSRNVDMSRVAKLAINSSIERSRKASWGARRAPGRLPICPGGQGLILRPSAVSRHFTAFAKALGLGGPGNTVTFHTLRHTLASVLLAGGMDWRALQEWLGHSSADITMRKYAHLMPGRGSEGATILDRVNSEPVEEAPWLAR